MTQRTYLPLLVALFISSVAEAKLEYDFTQLMMKNSDQLNELITKQIQIAGDAQAAQEDDEEAEGIHVEPAAIEALKAGMRIALSRPDQDGARAGLFARVRRELADLGAADPVIKELAQEAIAALKGDGPAKVQGTYVHILENLMAEIKPELESNATLRGVVEQIRDANIKISEKTRTQALMRTMSRPVSPSDTAAKILPKKKK